MKNKDLLERIKLLMEFVDEQVKKDKENATALKAGAYEGILLSIIQELEDEK